jgi:type I restriction enzyme M protein
MARPPSSGPSPTSCAVITSNPSTARSSCPSPCCAAWTACWSHQGRRAGRKSTREKAGLNPEPFLLRKSGQFFYNTSPLDLKKLMGDQDHIGENLRAVHAGFSPAVRDIFESFEFHTQIDKLAKSGLLYMVTEKFATIDLHPDVVSNAEMGAVFEELIRKFAELSNETAGEHFTPREVIRLMVNLLFIEDDAALTKPGVVRSLYDPTAGTGGMLSVAGEHLASLNPDARLVMYGQELNPESYAICKADMLIKGQDIANIIFGNTLSADGLPARCSTTCPVQSPVWRGVEEDRRRSSAKRPSNRATTGALAPACHASVMAPCCSCCTWCPRCARLWMAAAASASC